MEETAWAGSSQSMVWLLRGTSTTRTKVGRRKLRLFACGCCRLIWDHLGEHERHAVETAERFADGGASAAELTAAADSLEGRSPGGLVAGAPGAQDRIATSLAQACAMKSPFDAALRVTCYSMPLAGYRGANAQAEGLTCNILRDVFGNPFSPVAFSKSWRSDTAVSLARRMYELREFDAMPILADAMQDAGCEDEAILTHCRGDGVHVRGCWVVDLVLGKS